MELIMNITVVCCIVLLMLFSRGVFLLLKDFFYVFFIKKSLFLYDVHRCCLVVCERKQAAANVPSQ